LIFFYYLSALELLQIELVIFIGIYLFFTKFRNIFIKILPKKYKNQVASKNAQNQFYNLKQNIKKQNILFFISFEEKYIEIIVDDEISKDIPNSHWQNIIDEFVISIKENQLLSGYEKAIMACNSILIEKFPNNENEIK
jgi:putative membrane protein